MLEKWSRILVIRSGAIGDFILTLPTIGALRQTFPAAHIEIMGYPEIASLALTRYYADGSAHLEAADMAPFFARDNPLPQERVRYFAQFDLIIALWKDTKGIFAANLAKCRAGRIIMFDPTPPRRLHAAVHTANSLAPLGIRVTDTVPRIFLKTGDRTRARGFLANAQLDASRLVALHPGSGARSKNWPPHRFARLAAQLTQIHKLKPLWICGPADADVIDELRKHLQGGLALAKELPLPVLAATLERCRLYVGNDSGITHLSAAVGTPTVAIFGPTDEAVWGPRGEKVRIVHGTCESRPCGDEMRRRCPQRVCLERITVQDVMKEAQLLLPADG